MSDDTYDVGYGRPPKDHQFKKGRSGNPAGRPRRKLSAPEIISKVRDELIPITINGKKRYVTMFEASLRHSIANTFRSGNPRYIEHLMQILEKHGVTPAEVMAQNAREGADEAMRKIFQIMERVDPPPSASEDVGE